METKGNLCIGLELPKISEYFGIHITESNTANDTESLEQLTTITLHLQLSVWVQANVCFFMLSGTATN